ncbi:hypothetical protein CEE37_07835 [candidate division LCP-89 bacterium B3_LCP]|uniref:Uncharacterized protein n=1 Tax=candidate division LCP-89 bacterium B3_LCP TaxID=2012998 RepID=A0A532UZ63_UNCL8|nr:MAG: hypothetical protein CEE37_07835 [candidate division LCP-89 bacterium B3_LCP]
MSICILLISGCKGECKLKSDCIPKECTIVNCINKNCQYTNIKNCCGNRLKEEIEDGKPGNKCTCPADYGRCEGKGKIQVGSRTYDAQYLKYICENNKCVLGVDKDDLKELTLLDERDFSYFKLETLTTFNKPFDTRKDSFHFRIRLKDINDELVLPVKINKIILRDGEVLFGEKNVEQVLNGIGDKIIVKVPVTYDLEQLEEQRGLSYKMDYEYTKKVKDQRLENGSYTFKEELVRDDYENKFQTKIFFVKSG